MVILLGLCLLRNPKQANTFQTSQFQMKPRRSFISFRETVLRMTCCGEIWSWGEQTLSVILINRYRKERNCYAFYLLLNRTSFLPQNQMLLFFSVGGIHKSEWFNWGMAPRTREFKHNCHWITMKSLKQGTVYPWNSHSKIDFPVLDS